MDEKFMELASNNKTDIAIIKTKLAHIEKWMYLFIVEFHLGVVGFAVFKILGT